ncbi:helix-turn-helix domain-containing protein [Catellatospora chokoriensis]|uniref:Transcriptional regulator family protein n=2 Tax=Catellatospora chokoriensis TaxID=310353 RepID=A0A8J3JV97_9ACTN|nr:transcriptional regulator family protein [Catellatospora chokoriensis]
MTLTGTLADRDAWTADLCSIDLALGVVGTRSGMLIMREAHYGTTRYDDFVSRVGVTEKVAAGRLRDLVDAGLLERRPYRAPGSRTRHEYVLTPAGADLAPVLLALMQWGDRHLTGERGPALHAHHRECGAPVTVQARCCRGHAVAGEDIALSATPAADDARAPDAQP